MAISAPHYQLLKSIKHLLPVGGSLLEIGEANWYGDMEPDFPYEEKENLFSVAKCCYYSLFAPRKIVSIDFNGTPSALRLDLNGPIELVEQFDVTINHGTAEHVFNIGQVFATMHAHCTDGGLMIHESPFTGWIDHGFYCLQPTLFYDLAAANCYEVVLVALETIQPPKVIRLESRDHVAALATAGTLPNNAMLFVVFRKRGEAAFRIPMQGYYSRHGLSAAGQRAWSNLR